jgi:hypothetical protein
MENRVGFCLNPFLDIQLSTPALNAVPFLGKSLSFQLDMINHLSPKLASLPNGYGFNFAKGEPFRLKIAAMLWQHLPACFKHTLYTMYKKGFISDYIPKLVDQNSFAKEIYNNVLRLGLPLNISNLCLVRSRSKLLLNLGYFIRRNREKIRI